MLNPDLVRFMIKNNLEESAIPEKQEDTKVIEYKNKLAIHSQFAVVPIQVKE